MKRSELFEMFQRMATEIAEKDFTNVTEDSNIQELGLDSLSTLELVGAMERELNVQIPDEQLVGIQTVRQLLELVATRMDA